MSIDQQLVFEADRFDVYRLRYRGTAGREHARDVIRHPGAVVLLPVLADGRVVLIQNYRASIDKTLLEIPAGTIEAGEPPLETAHRELMEETGYRAGRMELLRVFYASPGICDELMHLFLATELSPGPPEREEYERIENKIAAPADILRWLVDGTIQDAKTLVGLNDYQHRFGGGR